jgi:hypothetical protein
MDEFEEELAREKACSRIVLPPERVKRVLSRTALLDPDDAELLAALLGRGEPPGEVAARLACVRSTVLRRFHRLVNLLESGGFAVLVQALPMLPRQYRDLAVQLLVRKKSIRAAALATGMTYHEARTRARLLCTWHRALAADPRAAAAIAGALVESRETAGSGSSGGSAAASIGGAA